MQNSRQEENNMNANKMFQEHFTNVPIMLENITFSECFTNVFSWLCKC